MERLRQESLENLERSTGKKKKVKKVRDAKESQNRLEPAAVEQLWTRVSELATVAEKENLSADKLDLYEVKRPAAATAATVASSSATTTESAGQTHPPSLSFTSVPTPVNQNGISSIIKNRHCAVSAICPHNHSNSSFIPPSNVHYFLSKAPSPISQRNSQPKTQCENPSSSSSSDDASSACRLVEISKDTAACPNCGDVLQPILMDSEDMKHVKSVLKTITTNASKVAGNKLQVLISAAKSHRACISNLILLICSLFLLSCSGRCLTSGCPNETTSTLSLTPPTLPTTTRTSKMESSLFNKYVCTSTACTLSSAVL